MFKLGIDTGGTFTDFVLQTPDGMRTFKTPSTPGDPGRAILTGLAHFFDELPAGLEIIHGTTVGTNAFLERKGARTVLVTTHGFEDLLIIGRQNRPRLYDLNVERPAEIIPRSMVTGVKERVRWDGSVLTPLGKSAGKRLRAFCRKTGAESVAVCLLHAYANPDHEKVIKKELAGLHIPVTISSEIHPEFREYERLTTTLINGYLAPVISSYITRLAGRLGETPFFIQQSNGGILPAASIAERAVHTVLSGPAGGVHGADQVARQMGLEKIITFDMGGTSTDVSLLDGAPSLTRDYKLDGYPVRIRMLDIHTVGAGGGSLVRVDAGGLLKVGPESAGADPGPVCYGKGRQLTVTDANLFLGRLLPEYFLGGSMRIQTEAVHARMEALASMLGLDATAVALGIIRIVNGGMAKAIRAVSVERGHDPRDFALFCFGGAAGLHCCELAAELGMRTIVVPARAGLLSAQGMVFAEPSLDYMLPLFLAGRELETAMLEESFGKLTARALAEAERLFRGTAASRYGEPVLQRFLNLRYQGQSHELCVEYDADFKERFHRAHEFAFGYRIKDYSLELTSIQCTLRLPLEKTTLPHCTARGRGMPEMKTDAPVAFAVGRAHIPVCRRDALRPGHQLAGPALVVDDYTTVLLTPGFHLSVDPLLNLILQSHL